MGAGATDRLHIGVLLDQDPCAYSLSLLAALEAHVRTSGDRVQALPVAWATPEVEPTVEAVDTTLRQADRYDAMVMLSGVFAHGMRGLSSFAQRWAPRPAVSVGYRLPGVPSVLVDNRGGMKAAVLHLVDEHQRREILFVRGRRDSHEAEERYLGFRHGLRERGILNDERRVITGDFTRVGALDALSKLAAEVSFDAVLAANDDMALAVLLELQHRSARIPEDVAVMGFDDVPAAARASIPLSSLAQPFAALAGSALDALGAQGLHTVASRVTLVPTQLVLRTSCGCTLDARAAAGPLSAGPYSRDLFR